MDGTKAPNSPIIMYSLLSISDTPPPLSPRLQNILRPKQLTDVVSHDV